MATPATILRPLTGNDLVDSLTNGTYWLLDSSRTVTWALSNFGTHTWTFPAETAYAMSLAFSSFQQFANINFRYVGIFSNPGLAPADIAISGDGIGPFFSSSNEWARAYFPNPALTQRLLPTMYRGEVYSSAPGDVWLNVDSSLNYQSTYQPGSKGFAVLVHELGHALGLKHPHDDGGTGRPTFAAVGESLLNIDVTTVMSYNETNPNSIQQWHPATPMILDVIALQSLYGPNLTNNAGNNTHTLTANNRFQTIFDPSGSDVVDLSGSSMGWTVNLTSDPDSTHPYNIGAAFPNDSIPQQTTLYWLYGQFEGIKGSNFADTIKGSSLSDSFSGGGGNDMIYGRDGNDGFYGVAGQDAIFGGDGSDAFNVGLAASQTIAGKLRDNAFIISDRSGNLSLVRDVEQLVFSDITVNLNTVAPVGNVDSALTQIYVAAFRRAPETSGYNYWLQQETATSISKVADTIFSLSIVKSLYPTAMTNAQFVSAIYQNVFNRTPDTEGLNYWVGQLNSATRGKLVLDMTNAALNVPDGSAGKDYFQNRLDWSIYSVVYQSNHQEMTPSHLASLTNRITDDPFTVLTLLGQAEAGLAI